MFLLKMVHNTHDASQREEAEHHLMDVASLKEICCLENLLVRHTVLLDGLLEPGIPSRVIN